MKYLIILYATYNNGNSDKKSIYEADTQEGAIASFHSYMGSYMKDEAVATVTVLVISQNGVVIKSENFRRVVEEE